MFKILHAFLDYPFCSFEFLKECGVNYDHELEGKIIEKIPSDLRIHTREYAVIRAQQYLEGSWLFPWLKKKK